MLPFEHPRAPFVTPIGGRYDQREVMRLARAGRVIATQRVITWLMNHDYDVADTLVEILSSLTPRGHWIGSVVLRNGVKADEYVVRLADEDWYLKFSLDAEQVVVHVWSCCWDGAVH
jgi:hypothetical protein